ncbi:PA14 domain-containing protein [Singulisphaera sp. GP187]|uniref:PA14 domain-containing protein n=1 Tax=Singulisphaera sp. GP187 TaxID=1882752 RepID=UPI00092AD70A|nr:PA14 domain-containing protein [Singulisphaera sp. GP187]SIN94788.1 PA14 domain-containing protein [Singulisphaera sp. GP187]
MSAEARKTFLILVSGWVILASSLDSVTATAAESAPDHPLIAGYERFFVDPSSNASEAGRLLFGELNCNSCHQAGKAGETSPEPKQAPILDAVGARVRTEYLRSFLFDPQAKKPGTTMPNLLAHLPEGERRSAVEALTHFLASSGRLVGINPTAKAIASGRVLYQQVGCLACHGSLEANAARIATSVPLGNLAEKYTLGSLTTFLNDPLKVRPSGRMPALGLTGNEAGELAAYLLRDLHEAAEPNLKYSYFEGTWENLPDFAALTPLKTGKTVGIDLTVARRSDNFALLFEGFFNIDRDGDYTFYLKSDDGSRLLLDGKVAVENDGIHAPKERRGTIRMVKGTHPIAASFFNGGAGAEFDLDYSGPGIPRQPITGTLSLTDQPRSPESKTPEERFVVEESLVARGRELFATVGCASCHKVRHDDSPIPSRLTATALAQLETQRGCLDPAHPANAPVYPLTDRQRESLVAAIETLKQPAGSHPTPLEEVSATFRRLNCYACHQRGGVGGVEEARNPFFQTKQQEMGDEGRIPPSLDGVGAKLTADYLAHIVSEGAKDRPYMLTRMPRFGKANAGGLIAAFENVDSMEPVKAVEFHVPPRRIKSEGRYLTGSEALACIKCHTFKGVETEGVQAIDMTIMTKRLKRDWFHRYLVDPQVFRPGTRMPVAWPSGKSLLPKVLGGDTRQQIEAIWQFLADGSKAVEPHGLGRDPIPLVAEGEPILYRNFIQGAGPRGIGVGYPEKLNLAFDANEARIALIWQGAFIDASRHWSARGAGFQGPLGDNVLGLPEGPGFATLETGSALWPTQPPKEVGYKFRGYRLDPQGRPTFLYDFKSARIADFPEPGLSKELSTLRRTLSIKASNPPSDLWFRAAVADKIESLAEGWHSVNGEWRIRIETNAEPLIRRSAGKAELLVPLIFAGDEAKIIEQIDW